MSLAIGLTGGVASGKSYVQGLFAELGVPIIEADDVGRAVVQPGEPALAEIAARFGADMLLADGHLNRPRMRERVFQDAAALRELEAITHPHIRARLRAWRDAQTAPYCLLSAAILLESGMSTLVSRVLVVDAPEQDQLSRLIRRDGIAEPLARAMLARQWTRAERLARADDLIDNPEPAGDLRPAVLALHRRYLGLAG
ncbi:dephospho-CoA kinase [Stagnimonas aquatica]|uniref:Dephospho-CoA kinase n=1 Tax=Stagnimonas aquatica TaxID=2689987 RepID=A0A3N0VKW4_9GAMM|nr:dephospho-CoA kinase [Stagnimonas aquatica]ROH93406.1 dephospho-CoA kinase [Stagnimonas aquatica]